MASAAENTPDREAVVCACVERHVGAVRSIEAIAADLGLRHFFRVHCDGTPSSVIARVDAEEDPAGRPAGVPPEPPLEPIRALLEANGLPVPACHGSDAAHGVVLLEDLGSETLEDAARDAARRETLYPRILRDVARLQEIPRAPGVAAFERQLDDALFAYKADLFLRHALPLGLGRPARPSEAAIVHEAFERIAAAARSAPQRLAHRDLQSRNILIRDGAPIWIDLQGAFLAPPEYDAVALLRDSYVPLPEAEVRRFAAGFRAALADAPDAATFEHRFDLLTISRKGKDLGRFAYVAEERGRDGERQWLAPTAEILAAAAARLAGRDPGFAALAELMDTLPGSPACAR